MCSREPWKNSFFPLASFTQRSAVLPCATTVASPDPSERRHQRGIHGDLCSVDEWKTVRDDLQPSSVHVLEGQQVEIPHQHVGGDASTGFPTHPSGGTFQSVASTTQHPCLRASCSVVATGVKWTATPADARGGGGEGNPKALKEEHSEEGGIHPGKTGGRETHVRDTRQRTALRSEQRLLCRRESGSDGALHEKAMDRFCGSALPPMAGEARFHVLVPPQLFGANSRCQLLPVRCVESSSCQMFPRGADPGQVERRVLGMQGVHYASTVGGVPLLHHLQTVCPARPVSGSGEQCDASETSAAERQWQAGQIPDDVGRSHPHESVEASSERCVVVRCETGSELWVDDSECKVGSSTAAVQE